MARATTRTVTALFALCALSLAAYNPPPGGEAVYDFYSPLFLGGGASVANVEAPASDALNPAAQAILQRFTLDASYIAMIGFGAERGWGNAFNLSASMPQPIGVWGAGLRLVTVPATLVSMPLGTIFSARGTFAKDLWPNFWLGAGISASVGSRYVADSTDWSLGADIGIMHLPGSISFMKNFRWGLVLAGLGKWYAPGTTNAAGLPVPAGSVDVAFPSPFTVKAGANFDFFKTPAARLSMSADLSFPFFQNLIFDTGLAFSFKEAAAVRLGWGINARELAAGSAASLIPSFGFDFTIPITTSKQADSFLSKQGWDRSDLRPVLSAKPLYNGVWAIGAGAVLPLGVVDRKPPAITVKVPESPYPDYYLSPNADGKNDEFVIPIKIADQRYVQSYDLTIKDSSGATVKEIKNKESRPENEGVQGFFSRLAYTKKGVVIPPEIKWDGRSDSGETVKDGAYTAVLTAVDDNGNVGSSDAMRLVVDGTPPSAALPSPADPDALVFSPDGDGNKDGLKIQASGSKEDAWKMEIRDAAGSVVRTYDFKDAPLGEVSWDGKNDAGQMVPDGVYRVSASSEDRARNAASVSMENIVVDTRQPPVSLSIDTGFFSPNGDGVRDKVALTPGVPVRNGLAEWSIAVKNRDGAEVWKVSGSGPDSLKNEYLFEGKDSSGRALPEGSYQAVLNAKYVNGHKPEISSPAFTLDVTPPKASVTPSLKIFSPNGDGRLDAVTFAMSASQEELWTAEIDDASGKAVNTVKYPVKVDAEFVWDGTDDKGALVPDGNYSYVLKSQDRAGNSGSSAPVFVKLDNEKKSVLLSSDVKNFSPNGDGVRDAATLMATVQAQENVGEWRLRVKSDAGADVRVWTAKGKVPERSVWNGKTDSGALATDGTYSADLWVRYVSGDEVSAQVQGIVIDTIAPFLTLKADPLLFSPDGDGRKDAVAISHGQSSPDAWNASITDSAGKAVREYSFPQGAQDIVWDATDAAGNKLPDGRYKYSISSTDKAGNKTERSVDGITIDTRDTSAYVTASRTGFSPNGDGKFDDISFGVIVKLREGITAWSFSIKDASGAARKTWSGTDGKSIPTQIPWDGKSEDGKVANGAMVGVLSITYAKGDEVEARTPALVLDVDAPQLKVALAPMPFSPDNDGIDDEVTVSLSVQDATDVKDWKFEIFEAAADDASAAKQRLFMKYEGQGQPAARVTWDGKSLKGETVEAATDYPWALTVTDSLGNVAKTSGVIPVDVLVIRDGNRLKIAVPSIVFRPDFADFVNLSQDVIDRNFKVVKRIAQILNKYGSYKVLIEGHANSIGKIYDYSAAKIQEEEQSSVIPLSKARADAIKTFLVQNGVDEKRLTTAGIGSQRPVVNFKDADNRWKNRRVEFILEK